MQGPYGVLRFYHEVERRSLMRGSIKILLALIAVVMLAAPFARAGDLGLPTDKTASSSFRLVYFEGVTYRIVTEIPCEVHFSKVDENHHRLVVLPLTDGVTPFCDVMVQWGNFPYLTLGLFSGGANTWILGTETGYAEK
jgi:hypothetical protein